MAVTTLKGHVNRARDFYNKQDIYFALGKGTPWTEADRTPATPGRQIIDEMSPPVPMNTDELKEPIAYKKVETMFHVVPDDNGTLVYKDTKWKIVEPHNAITEGARWVYISTTVAYNEVPTNISYRQIGCYTGLRKKQGVSTGKYALLPTEVEDAGVLEVLDNRRAIYREADQREKLVLIIEF